MAKDSYFSSRNGSNSYGKGRVVNTYNPSKSSRDAGAFMEANQRIESAVEGREKIYNEVAKAVASYAIASNKDGASSVKNITEEIGKLLRDFNAEERVNILTKAMASVIINM